MKIEIDTAKIAMQVVRWLKCFIKHDWETRQEIFTTEDNKRPPVICWRVCNRCAKSQLIHIL